MSTASSASIPGSTGPPSAYCCWYRDGFVLAISGALHSWASTTAHTWTRSHIHVLFAWTHLLLDFCGAVWSVSLPTLRSPAIILDPNQVLEMCPAKSLRQSQPKACDTKTYK